jgi:hypothetical protein
MRVWYASYGSNLSRDRFLCYLRGGRPEGATRTYPGARDTSDPQGDDPLVLPGQVFFGWRSPTWGGGIAFYDADAQAARDAPDPGAYARAYLLTEGQFADVAAQEMHRVPGDDLDLSHVLERARHSYGPGRYETLHLVGELRGDPVLTFSATDPAALERRAPSAPYVAMIVRGLVEAHGLSVEEAARHVASRPGAGDWTAADIAALDGLRT